MLLRRIALRIALIAALTCAVAALTLLIASWSFARGLAADRIGALAVASGTPLVRAHCEAEQGSFAGPGEITYRLFSNEGTALTPNAPALDPQLRARLVAEDSPSEFDASSRETRIAFRVSDVDARCALVVASWHPRATSRGSFFLWVGVLLLALVMAAAWLVHASVAAPLIERLQRLREAALRVGTDEYIAAPTWRDEAGEIAQALDSAHRNAKARAQ